LNLSSNNVVIMELKRGNIFDGYTLIENIGSGSTADVWKVESKDGVIKAMKIYSPTNKLTDFDKKILKKEFDFAKNLSNTNILPLEKHGEFDGIPYIIMPLAETSLMQILHNRMNKYDNHLPYFNEKQLATILFDVTNALNYLKTKKLIHKDLKPDNILVLLENDEERLVLMDFNISTSLKQKILSQTRSLSESTSGMTPAYAAPEFLKGKEHQNSDIFSLGITLYELAIGEAPSSTTNIGPAEILINGGELPTLNIRSFSKEFSTLLQLCLDIDPENRPDAKKLFEWADYYLNNERWPQEIFEYQDNLEPSKVNFRNNKSTIIQTGNGNISTPYNNFNSQYETIKPNINHNIFSFINKIINIKYLKYLLLGLASILLLLFTVKQYNRSKANTFINQADNYFENGFIKNAINDYKKASELSNNRQINDKINIASKLLKYDEVKHFENRIARVKKGNKWGLVDKEGIEILPPSYKKIIPFRYGIAAVELENGGCGFINSRGQDIGSNSKYKKCEVIGENRGRVKIGNNTKTITLNN